MISLDVGCGKRKRGTIGVDYSRQDSNADVIADACFLPFKDAVFDEIVSFTVIEHSPNPLNFLREQFRVLEKGGKIVVTTDNAEYFAWSVLGESFGGYSHDGIYLDHYMIFILDDVKKLLRMAGFKVDKTFYVDKCTSKLSFIAELFVKLGFWRQSCLYRRFNVTANKI